MRRHHFLMQWMENAIRSPNRPTSQCTTSKIQYHFPNWLVQVSLHLRLNWTPLVMLVSQLRPIVRHFLHAEAETNKSKLKNIIVLFLSGCPAGAWCVQCASRISKLIEIRNCVYRVCAAIGCAVWELVRRPCDFICCYSCCWRYLIVVANECGVIVTHYFLFALFSMHNHKENGKNEWKFFWQLHLHR